jgi:hypothetical protein
MLIEETIKEFLKYKNNYSGYNKKTVENLMLGDKEYSLIKINGLGELKAEELKESIKLSVKLYTRNKDRAIDIYKKYLDFLKTKYGIHVDINFPPIPFHFLYPSKYSASLFSICFYAGYNEFHSILRLI